MSLGAPNPYPAGGPWIGISRELTAIFTCGHCGIKVPPAGHNRNACPDCGWSKHLQYGTEVGHPPCGELMESVRPGVWHCTGCPYMQKGPTEQELKRIRRTDGMVSWRTGVQGSNRFHLIMECIKIAG